MAHKAKSKKKPQETSVTNHSKITTSTKIDAKSTTKAEAKKAESDKKTSAKTCQTSTLPAHTITHQNVPTIISHAEEDLNEIPIPIPTSKPLSRKERQSHKTINAIGSDTLATWKHSPAGSSKSWSSSTRIRATSSEVEHLSKFKTVPISYDWQVSTITTPATFLRSHGTRTNLQSEVTKTKKRIFKSRKPVIYENSGLGYEYGIGWLLPRDYPSRRPVRVPEPEEKNLGGYRIRLTISLTDFLVKQEEFLKEIHELSVLPEVPRGQKDAEKAKPKVKAPCKIEHMKVVRLLQNESHADVYLVRKYAGGMVLGPAYHAYHFLSGEGFSGNWATFMKRKVKRLKNSSGFYGDCIQDGRKIVVMEIEKKETVTAPAESGYSVKNMANEFPTLPRADTKASKPKPKKYRVSYAAIAGRKKPAPKPLVSNHPAHKAWENRHGKGKPSKTLTAKEKKEKDKASKKASEDFVAWVKKGQKQDCPLRNRFEVLSNPVVVAQGV